MNRQRRNEIQKIIDRQDELKRDLENIQFDEEEYRDSMPENMQSSERYEKADAACDNISDAVDTLQEGIDYLTEAME